jgi:hypothetical protein
VTLFVFEKKNDKKQFLMQVIELPRIRCTENLIKKFFYSRVARFFMVQYTKYTKSPQNIPNGHKIYQLAAK